ncbi:hypothetical protein D354_00530 [Enterococcus faecalis]|nr:hypothetical protein [Listeria monocytogenes]EAC5373204.1 hypothetical protein [Listeria monocytogenes]EAK8886554.1 hypothetical protein [Listeria monocytogenes]EPI25129.1 hypothetical protein D354_00530 [Enterococcus faecalis]
MIYLYQLYKVIMFIFLTYLFTSLFLSFRTRKKNKKRSRSSRRIFLLLSCTVCKRGESHRRNIKKTGCFTN